MCKQPGPVGRPATAEQQWKKRWITAFLKKRVVLLSAIIWLSGGGVFCPSFLVFCVIVCRGFFCCFVLWGLFGFLLISEAKTRRRTLGEAAILQFSSYSEAGGQGSEKSRRNQSNTTSGQPALNVLQLLLQTEDTYLVVGLVLFGIFLCFS